MSPNGKQKRGRPANKVLDESGHQVIGLTYVGRKNAKGEIYTHRYFAIGTKPKKYFGEDLEQAIAAFRRWQSDNKEALEILPSKTWNPTRIAKDADGNELSDGDLFNYYEEHGDFPYEIEYPESAFWKKVVEVFSTREGRNKAAKLTGYTLIKKLDQPDAFPRTLTLKEIGELYYGKRDGEGKLLKGQDEFNTNEFQKAWKSWRELCKAVKVYNLHEITRDKFESYRRFITGLKLSARTIKNRYNTIGQILNKTRDRRENHTEVIDKVRDSFRIICRKKAKKVPKSKSTPIAVEDFSAMVAVANTKFKAVLYLMLNAGLHPGELTGLTLEDLHLEDGYLLDHRNKTIEERCSILWPETIQAVQEYLKEFTPTDYLFVNRVKGRHTTAEFGKEFYRKVRDPAGADQNLTLEWFRDSGTTAASQAGVSLSSLKCWLGQTRQDVDGYDNVEPLHTKPVVDAIYNKYKIADISE